MTLTLNWFAAGRRLCAVMCLALGAVLAAASPVQAIVTIGESSGYGVSSNIFLNPAPDLVIVDEPTTGSIAPRRAWTSTTRRSLAPFARAVRMKSCDKTSNMPVLVSRAM
jgi:hypothetical protein